MIHSGTYKMEFDDDNVTFFEYKNVNGELSFGFYNYNCQFCKSMTKKEIKEFAKFLLESLQT